MALMLAIWRPQPNWIPKKPKLMFQICQKVSRGFCMGVEGQAVRSCWSTGSIQHCQYVEASQFGGEGAERAHRWEEGRTVLS